MYIMYMSHVLLLQLQGMMKLFNLLWLAQPAELPTFNFQIMKTCTTLSLVDEALGRDMVNTLHLQGKSTVLQVSWGSKTF